MSSPPNKRIKIEHAVEEQSQKTSIDWTHINKELELIRWSLQYLKEKNADPNYKRPEIDEYAILTWCENFLQEKNTK